MNEELKVIISAETAKFKKAMEEAKQSVDKFKTKTDSTSKEVDKIINKMGDGLKKVGKKIAEGVAIAAAALGGLSIAALNARSDLEQGMGGSEAVFGNYVREMQQAAQKASDACNLSAGEYLNYANKMGALFQGTGITVQQSAEMTQNYMQRAADVASIMGVDVASAMEAVTGAAKGNFTMMDNLGVAMNETTLASYALAKGYEKPYEKMTQAEKEMVAYEMFMEKTQYAAGNCAKEHDTLAGSMELLKANWKNFISSAGDWSSVTDAVANAKEVVVQNLIDMAEGHPELQEAIQKVSDAIDEAYDIAVQAFDYVINNWGTIEPIIVAIGTAIGVVTAAITAYNVVTAIKEAMDVAQVTTLGALAAATWAALAPYLLIAAAITALIAVIVLCIKHWEDIKKEVTAVWQTIKTAVSEAVSNVVGKIQEWVGAVKEKVEAIKTAVSEKWETIKNNVNEKTTAIKNNMSEKWENIKTTISGKVDNIKSNVTEKFEAVKTAVKSKFDSIKETATSVWNNIKYAITHPVEAARDAVKAAIDKIKSFFDFKINFPHVPLPHFVITPAGWKIGDLLEGKIPKLSVQMYAKGGVFDSTTLFGYGNGQLGALGENGAEAVVPLEKNTKWLDRIAERLGGRSNTPIILQVDGKTFAETSIDSINRLTRQTGSLGLNLV